MHLSKVYDTRPTTPQLIVNVLNGGAHAGNGFAITESMLLIKSSIPSRAVACAVSVYSTLRSIIYDVYGPTDVHVGLEGGFAPHETDCFKVMELLELAINNSADREIVSIGLDVAASNLFDAETGRFNFAGEYLTFEEVNSYYVGLAQSCARLAYLEDPFDEDHAEHWARLRTDLPGMLIAGDDLTATSSERLRLTLLSGAINAVVLKINQCGTVTALANCMSLARANSLVTVMSQRSCETDTDFLVHLAVGLGSNYLKAGACARERIVKYNSLLRIGETFQALEQNGSDTVRRSSCDG
jgi:enolase